MSRDMDAISQACDERRAANGINMDEYWRETPSQEQLLAAWSILANSFKVTVNANDLFYWGCADATEIDGDDLPLLIEASLKFGHAGEVAFQQKVRGGTETVNCLERRGWKDKYPEAVEWMSTKMLEADLDARIAELTAPLPVAEGDVQ